MSDDMPEAEARALLDRELTCEDASWAPVKSPKGTMRLVCGLLDEDGRNVGLYVECIFMRSLATRLHRMKMSVFQATPRGPRRVYQLHVEQMKVAPKNPHAMAHEHMGDSRPTGTTAWLSWSYEDALVHFCQQTGIVFIPPPPHPEHFELEAPR